MHARAEHGDMDEFRKALQPNLHKIDISKSMTNEITRPSRESKKITDRFEVAKTYKVSIQGAPGTGKTTFLREIALKNLSAGAKVLSVCFNKVLAADQKREYQMLREKKEDYGFIDVFYFWELFKELGHQGGLDNWGKVIENVKNYLESEDGKSFVKYDVILIDESQDLPDYFFKVIELIARPSASWFVAYGKGQETYNFSQIKSHPSQWLGDFLEKSEVIHRKRSFRNSTRTFLIAQAIWEKYPDLSKAKEWLADKLLKKSKNDDQFELDLELPTMNNDLRIEILPSGFKRELFIRNLILTALEESKQADRGGDLLVAVIKPNSQKDKDDELVIHSEYDLVKSVLESIAENLNIDFLDLVPDESRNVIPKNGVIRLVTLQNIRGLSASHVIVFDLPQIENWLRIDNAGIKPPLVNLAYIALSRSKSSTIIALDGVRDSEFENFLLNIFGYYQEMLLKN
jgi:superfamily I DNA and RNA helicase